MYYTNLKYYLKCIKFSKKFARGGGGHTSACALKTRELLAGGHYSAKMMCEAAPRSPFTDISNKENVKLASNASKDLQPPILDKVSSQSNTILLADLVCY